MAFPTFFSDPGVAIVFPAVMLAAVVIELRVVWSRSDANAENAPDTAISVATVSYALILILAASEPDLRIGSAIASAYLGTALAAGGVMIRAWAVWHLGKFFSPRLQVADSQTVVTNGPYRYMRHPGYTGALTFFLGLALTCDSWLALAGWLALVPAVLLRIRREETLLVAKLGDSYRAYAQSVPALFPHTQPNRAQPTKAR